MPISVSVAHSKTGKQLKQKFGRDGVLVWVLYLLACKSGWIQGQFSYTSESDGWGRLGLLGDEPSFTLEDFFKTTGSLKQTSRRRSGDLTDVISSNWEMWNDDVKRQQDAEKKSRKRGTNTATLNGTNGDGVATLRGTEVEVEVEYEEEVEGNAGHEPANAARPAFPRGVTRDGLSSRTLHPNACPECEIVAGHTTECTNQSGDTA